MAGHGRFASHTTDDILSKKSQMTPKSTKLSNNAAAKILKEYLCEKQQDASFEDFSPNRLAEVLTHFYLDVRTKGGNMYKATSLESIRHGLNRYLKDPPYSKRYDILKGNEFIEANESFKTAIKELKAAGLAKVDHYPEIIAADRQKMYTSMHMNPLTPYGLINKVQFDIRLYFCRRGSENMDKMTKSTFIIKTDGDTGLKYVTKNLDELTKNHRVDKENVSGFMPEEHGSIYCPVASFEKYLSKLNKKNDRLWQYPRDSYSDEDEVWYTNKPIGRDTLSSFMTKLSKKCGLSQIYTNHSIRATGATILSRQNFNNSQIMSVTGHKSVTSLAVYQRVSDEEKMQMGLAMSDGISPTAMSNSIQTPKPQIMPPPFKMALPPIPTSLHNANCSKEIATCASISSISQSSEMPNAQVLPDELLGLDMNDIFGEFDCTNAFAITQVESCSTRVPIFMNCSFGDVNITINK